MINCTQRPKKSRQKISMGVSMGVKMPTKGFVMQFASSFGNAEAVGSSPVTSTIDNTPQSAVLKALRGFLYFYLTAENSRK